MQKAGAKSSGMEKPDILRRIYCSRTKQTGGGFMVSAVFHFAEVYGGWESLCRIQKMGSGSINF